MLPIPFVSARYVYALGADCRTHSAPGLLVPESIISEKEKKSKKFPFIIFLELEY